MRYLKLYEEFKMLNEALNVYHGSTVKFDKFDSKKIGSGDGKNLGGWGFYFSDDRKVSDRYYLSSGFVKKYKIRDAHYFNLDDTLDENTKEEIINQLQNENVKESDIEQFRNDYISYENTNKQVLEWLEIVLPSPKDVSMLISNLGYIGNTFEDKWEIGSINYVVFDPKNIIEEIPLEEDEDIDESTENRKFIFLKILEIYQKEGGNLQRIIFSNSKPNVHKISHSWTHIQNYYKNYIEKLANENIESGKIDGSEDVWMIHGLTPSNNINMEKSLELYQKNPEYEEIYIDKPELIKINYIDKFKEYLF